MDIKQITNEELEQTIYEAVHEMNDHKYLTELLNERNRRSLEE